MPPPHARPRSANSLETLTPQFSQSCRKRLTRCSTWRAFPLEGRWPPCHPHPAPPRAPAHVPSAHFALSRSVGLVLRRGPLCSLETQSSPLRPDLLLVLSTPLHGVRRRPVSILDVKESRCSLHSSRLTRPTYLFEFTSLRSVGRRPGCAPVSPPACTGGEGVKRQIHRSQTLPVKERLSTKGLNSLLSQT